MLTDKQITEYRTLYKKHFGKNISKEEAMEQGENLVYFVKLCLPKNYYEIIGKTLSKNKKP